MILPNSFYLVQSSACGSEESETLLDSERDSGAGNFLLGGGLSLSALNDVEVLVDIDL